MAREVIFHYSHILPRKPSPTTYLVETKVWCRKCGAQFVTKARTSKYCQSCRLVAKTEYEQKSYARKVARKKAVA
jgi:hypothetical protein